MKYVEDNFPYFFLIFDEKLANFCVILHEITKIMVIGHEQDFTI